jgi:hypothetical protein
MDQVPDANGQSFQACSQEKNPGRDDYTAPKENPLVKNHDA